MPSKRKEHSTGDRQGKLVLIDPIPVGKSWGSYLYKFRCDCGNEKVTAWKPSARTAKSCGCLHKERCTGNSLKRPPGEANFHVIYIGYVRAARRRKLVFEITPEVFRSITKQNCTYCGIEPGTFCPTSKYRNGLYLYNGLDRVDHQKGYTPSNVVPCCKSCNYAKHIRSVPEFFKWVKRVYEKNSLQNL